MDLPAILPGAMSAVLGAQAGAPETYTWTWRCPSRQGRTADASYAAASNELWARTANVTQVHREPPAGGPPRRGGCE